jgi:hypothetical protein
MSEITLLSKNLPAHLRAAELDATTKALMGGGGGDTKRISIEGGVWKMMVNGKEVAKYEDRTMNVVIVAAAPEKSRTYYGTVYKKGVVASPDCWSADSKTPDAKAKNPQATKCADCPQNIKGSGQGDSRACRFSQRLAVVLENDIGGDVYQLTLPATSIWSEAANGKWALQTYAKMVAGKGIPISSVVTEMRFDTDSATPKITFKAVRYLETEEFEQALEQGKTDAATRAITMTVAQVDGVKDVEAEEEEADEPAKPAAEVQPVKRVSKKEEAPAPKKDVSKILEEWDNE